MASIKLNGKEIYCKQYGKGNPLILIAGLGSDSVSWLPVIISLSNRYQVITFDNRGVGRSSNDNTNITISDMADDCVGLIKHFGFSKVNVLGHSMGGMIAMDLSIRYPELVNNLILEATTPTMNKRNNEMLKDWVIFLKNGMNKKLWIRNMFYWIFAPSFFNDVLMFDQAVDMATRYRYAQSDISFEYQVKALSEFDCTTSLSKINAKTMIVYGEKDLLFPSIETSNLFNEISKKDSVTIKNAAHSIHMDRPEQFVATVTKFLG